MIWEIKGNKGNKTEIKIYVTQAGTWKFILGTWTKYKNKSKTST